MIGQTLAHYKILEKIGSGGMGDVYLAEDTKLDRKVALKVLPPELAENEERRARFKREAKALAALDHPNIVQVFSVEEAEGIHFITMQLVRGKTLTELLPKNGFPLNKFFEIAIPLADAVAAAHQEGITHRDLKPDNMMVGDDGRIKVLDFGLAKPTSGFVGGDADSALPTAARTAEGVIVGTLNYMSPEQAQGKAVDARSDIFSFGVVLYEMLTGQRPFGGETPAEILSSIIKDTPESTSDVNPSIPRDLAKLVRRCLAKDPIRRYQSAVDLRNELEETKQEVESGEAFAGTIHRQPKSTRRWPRGLWLGGAVVGLAAVALLIWTVPPRDSIAPRFTNPVQLTSASGVEDHPTWSPEGGRIAYESNQSGNWDIWVAQVGGGQPVNLTEDHTGDDLYPSWSPDGRLIALSSTREGGGCFVMSALGGKPRRVSEAAPQPMSLQWSADGERLACTAGRGGRSPTHGMEIVSIGSGEVQSLPLTGSSAHRLDLSWSPDGAFLAYVDAGAPESDATQVWILRLGDGEAIPVTQGLSNDWSPTWLVNERALYYVSNRGGSMDLWKQSLSADGRPSGDPRSVTTGIGMRRAAFSPKGDKLTYSKGRPVANLWKAPILPDRPVTLADAQQLTFDDAEIEYVDVSPDGKRLLVNSDRGGNHDLWMLSSEGGEMEQLTTDPGLDYAPQWSPDGKEIVFGSNRSGHRDIWVMPVDGGAARQLTVHELADVVPAWSPDGRMIVFVSHRSGNRDLWVVPAQGGEAEQFTVHADTDSAAHWSPDGKWIVFSSARSGQRALWRAPAVGGEPEPLNDNGNFPRWFPDGREIYFYRAGNIWSLTWEDGSERQLTDLDDSVSLWPFSLAADGEYLYFSLVDDVGDIWVMDVVTDESE